MTRADDLGAPRGFFFLGGLFSALLLGLSFPPESFRLSVWFALVPLLVSLHRQRKHLGLRLLDGLIFGLVATAWILHPLIEAAFREREAQGASLAGCLWHATVRGGGTWVAITFSWMLFSGLSGVLLRRRRWWLPLLGLPLLWTGIEYARLEGLPYTFPYLTLGSALEPSSREAQAADLFGLYGLSFLICLANSGFFLALREKRWQQQLGLVSFSSALFVACLIYGSLDRPTVAATTFRVAALQTGKAPGSPAGPPEGEARLALARPLLPAAPDLFLLSLSSYPRWPVEMPEVWEGLEEFARRVNAAVLVGVRIGGGPGVKGEEAKGEEVTGRGKRSEECGGAMLLLDRQGVSRGQNYLRSRSWFTGNRSGGSSLQLLEIDEMRLGGVPDADAYRPRESRQLTARGAGILLSAASDPRIWGTDLARLHMRLSALRAVENRRWLVRATQGGLSAFVSPTGALQARAPVGIGWGSSEEVEHLVELTLFTTWGWVLGPLSMAAAGLVLLLNVGSLVIGSRRFSRRQSTSSP